MKGTSFCLLLCTSIGVATAHGQASADYVNAAQTALLAQTSSVQSLDTVSPQTQQAIARLQDALVKATDMTFAALVSDASMSQAEDALRKALPAESVGASEFNAAAAIVGDRNATQTSVSGLYGSGLRVRVTAPRPNVRMVQESFVLPCGDETALLVYRTDASSWKRVLRWQSGAYSRLTGAYGDGFEAMALSAELHGLPLIAVKHGSPACKKGASTLSLTVLQMSDERSPRVVWTLSQPYRPFDLERMSKLSVTPDGFSIHASFPSLDPEQGGKEASIFYRATSQGVTRATPLAQRAVDVVDEWFRMPWSEAKGYIESADHRHLEGIHWRVHKDHGSNQHIGPVRYLSERRCNDSKTREQVELDLQPGNPSMEETAMVLVDPNAKFPIQFASATLDPACDGSDQLHADTSRSNVSP